MARPSTYDSSENERTERYFLIFYSEDGYFTIRAEENEEVIFEAEFKCHLYDSPPAELILELCLYRTNSHLPTLEEKTEMIHELSKSNELEPFCVTRESTFIRDIFRFAWLIENSKKHRRNKKDKLLLKKFITDINTPPNSIKIGGKVKIFQDSLFIRLEEIQARHRSKSLDKSQNQNIQPPTQFSKYINQAILQTTTDKKLQIDEIKSELKNIKTMLITEQNKLEAIRQNIEHINKQKDKLEAIQQNIEHINKQISRKKPLFILDLNKQIYRKKVPSISDQGIKTNRKHFKVTIEGNKITIEFSKDDPK